MSSGNQKVGIVTGAARGIGAATARRLAEDGYAVALLDLDDLACKANAQAINDAGGRAIGLKVDVIRAEEVASAVAAVAEQLGPPTALVNNAGITRGNLLFKMNEADWDAVIGVHLRGAFLMSLAVQTHMIESHWGRIVNLSSTFALGNRGQANYSAAKAGLQGFTKTLAIELGKFGVTVNSIAPGFIVTDMTVATAARLGVSFEEFSKARAEMTQVARVGEPEDVANAVSFFLTSARRSSPARFSTSRADPSPNPALISA